MKTVREYNDGVYIVNLVARSTSARGRVDIVDIANIADIANGRCHGNVRRCYGTNVRG